MAGVHHVPRADAHADAAAQAEGRERERHGNAGEQLETVPGRAERGIDEGLPLEPGEGGELSVRFRCEP